MRDVRGAVPYDQDGAIRKARWLLRQYGTLGEEAAMGDEDARRAMLTIAEEIYEVLLDISIGPWNFS